LTQATATEIGVKKESGEEGRRCVNVRETKEETEREEGRKRVE
jgi:hypothetical protein